MTDPGRYARISDAAQRNVMDAQRFARQAADDQARLAARRRTNRAPAASKSYPHRAKGTLWDRFLQFLRDL